MRVMTNHNPHSYQQQKTNSNSKDKNFADMLAGMAANKHGKPEAAKDGAHRPPHTDDTYSPMCLVNPHRHHGTEGKLKIGQLVLAKEPCTAELVEDKVPEPTYPKSIYDFSFEELKEAKFGAELACRNLETSGMTKGEIYREIETIYKNYLGQDFAESASLYYGSDRFTEHERSIWNTRSDFHDTLIQAGIVIGDSDTVREARGYANMSDDEIRTAVRAQYPDTMTFKDCVMMGHELFKLGFDDGMYGAAALDQVYSTLNLNWSPQSKQIYDAIFDMPASYDAIIKSYDAFVKDDKNFYPTNDVNTLVDRLLSFFGGGDLAGAGITGVLRDMLNKMYEDGDLAFDKFGYCGSAENINKSE